MEKPQAVSSMNANSKLPDDKDHQLQNRMLKTYTAIGVAAMKLVLESVQHAARLKAELVNSPLIAQDDNLYHSKSQINMSQAQMYDGPLTITDLGPSGDRHNDNNDRESGYSNASVHLHLPADYHPGLFMFYELGVFICLDRNVNFCFSGLRYHGGTPPTVPPGVIPPAWNARILTMQYPARHLMNMSARQSLATLPGGSIIYVTLEMQEHCIMTKEYRLWSTRATYVTDGSDLMSCKAHTTFVGRLLLWLCQHTLRGMPYNVKIDPSTCLASIKYQDENGDICSVEPWQFSELIANMSVEQKKRLCRSLGHSGSTCGFNTDIYTTCSSAQEGSQVRQDIPLPGMSQRILIKDGFHRPKNHQGFNDDSDEEEEELDIFGDEGINQDNLNMSGRKKSKKRKAKQGQKGNKKRKEDNDHEQ
ncbi:hypothetical protein K439DRAFT_1625107 [Ramaria rubella]|nr:hypothetical protein K439DRAFT_1625107 [Ramaria rubella]